MKDIKTVMKFTITDMVKRKSFIISTLIILLMIIVGFNIPNIINSFSDSEKEKIIIVDKDNIYENNLSLLNSMELDYEIIIDNLSEEDIKEKISNEEIDKGIIINKNNNDIEINYIVNNILIDEYIPEDLLNTLNSIYTNIQINKLGLNEYRDNLFPNFIVNMEQVEEEVNGNVLAMMLMSIVLFYAIYFCAYQVSSSITTEKTSKIIETLVTSTSPTNIVLGKTLGIGLVGLMQLILIILVSLITAKYSIDKELLSMIVDLSSITLSLGIITILYFILGYFVYALLYALTGSTVSKPEDIQSANTPVAIISVICFYLSYFTMVNPNSSLNLFASLFPFSSPFCMPFRVMMGIATLNELIISIILLVVTIFIIAKITINIYSKAILNYGTKLSLKEIINLIKN